MSSGTVQWSNLPKDLVIMVAKCLETSIDVLRLRAVCSSWRSSVPHPPPNNNSPPFSVKFPFPIAPNIALNPKRCGHFILSERKIYYLEPCNSENPPSYSSSSSSKGWMVSVEELSKPGNMRMVDPLSKYKFVNPPEIPSKVIDLLSFRVWEVSKVCNLQFVNLRDDLETNFNESKSMNVKKIVMSSVPAGTDGSAVDFAVLAIHTGGKLGFFKLGDKKWSMIDDGQERSHYDDILYHNGEFYAVDYTGTVYVIDLMLNVRQIESPVPEFSRGEYKYLVESLGDLYLVVKYERNGQGKFLFQLSDSDEGEDKEGDPHCIINFEVFKFNDDESKWVEVRSLGDQAFFIGDGCCFSLSAKQFSGCKGNCIYFEDIDFTRDGDYPGHGVGIFDLENERVGPLSSFKCYSQIFWPPPTWLNSKASSKPPPKASLQPFAKPCLKPSSSDTEGGSPTPKHGGIGQSQGSPSAAVNDTKLIPRITKHFRVRFTWLMQMMKGSVSG